jgi:hypothetical protein
MEVETIDRISAEVRSRASRERPHKTVCAPSVASLRATAWPMPRPAPVMTATWPVSGPCDDDSIFVKAIFLLPTHIVFRQVRLCIEHEELCAAVCFSIQPDRNDRKNEWRKTLALEGVHPYNPLTGIMLKPCLIARRPMNFGTTQ